MHSTSDHIQMFLKVNNFNDVLDTNLYSNWKREKEREREVGNGKLLNVNMKYARWEFTEEIFEIIL